jgi:uncharacterized Zn-binding protein involved in type VI secretion
MPRPAARVLDLTNHGGVILGPGAPSVLIGSQPAARAGDAQVCPMVDGVKPHVGGAITTGSATVLINGLAAARIGDAVQCVGPPGTIQTGFPGVLIG